ncbi:MAG: hypothetical protein HC929_07305 [Leptolyngbyaceae cyanobacterium SM2_5_2]|nr:hypothetical protein [Leptolyngbyaceae cyanobacterium SM2_5_2]
MADQQLGAGRNRLPSDRPTEPGATTMQTQTITTLPSPRSPNATVATPPRPSATPAQSPRVGASPPAASQPATRPPQPLQVAPPAVNASPPQPLAANSTPPVRPPAPLTPAAANPAPRPNYYVVTDYTGNASLESARGAVGDAYVRDFGGGSKIQMGAFSQESSAQNLVNQLQQQGIPARVYTP